MWKTILHNNSSHHAPRDKFFLYSLKLIIVVFIFRTYILQFQVKPDETLELRLIEPVVLLRDCFASPAFDNATQSSPERIVDDANVAVSSTHRQQDTQSMDNDADDSDVQIVEEREFKAYKGTIPFNRKPFQCLECSSRYIREDHFRRHQEMHKKAKEPPENKIYHSVFSLRHRLSTVLSYISTKKCHLKRPRPFRQCRLSTKAHAIAHADLLGRESSSEVRISRYLCDMCPAQFEHESHLKSHLNIHKKRPFTCKACFRMFTTKSALKMHSRKHRMPTRYICPICYIEFPRKSFLKEHLQFHVSF